MINGLAIHPKHLSICSGIGGIDLGLEAALGVRTVGHIERDAFAASILVERMEEQALDNAPIWDDLTTFESSDWSGCVDILSAGFPCQPFSYAGKHEGVDDDRWLWPHIRRISENTGPCQIFIENTPGLVKKGLYEILFDLAEMGYDAEWGLFNASDAGAPHKRQRLFLLAHKRGIDRFAWTEQARICTDLREKAMGDAYCEHLERSWSQYGLGDERQEQDQQPGGSGTVLANTNRDGRFGSKKEDGEKAPLEIQGWHFSYGRFAPSRNDSEGWREWCDRGLPQPTVRGDAHGTAHRVDRLRSLGNSVVPSCVTLAYNILLDRLNSDTQPVK
jgi:DNA (cytosine-5)-methyltransferase 1